MNNKIKHTELGEPKSSFSAIIREGQLLLNLSYAISEADDGNGNPVTFRLWINGDWNIEYKGKEYLIKVNDNVSAFIDWINEQEKINE